MLRINLLPPYIFDKQKKIQVAIVWGVAAAVVIGLFIVWNGGVASQLGSVKKDLDEANSYKTDYDNYDTQIKGVNDKVAVVRSKQTFIANAKTSNDSWPTVYEAMRDVTAPTILLEALYVSPAIHKQLNFTGFAKDELTIARWWMYLRNAKDRFDSVTLQLPVHSYTPEAAQGGAGGFAGMGNMRNMMGGPGMRGMPAMMGGPGMMGSSPMTSSMGGMMPGRMSGMPAMAGGMSGMPAMAGGMRGISGAGGFGGRGMGGNNAGGNVGPTEIEGRPGLNFTGYAMVKDTLAPPVAPTWPAGGGAAGGMGGFGGMSGMPAGMMGGPGMPAMMGGGRMSGGPAPMAGAPPAAGSMGGKKGGGED